MADTMAFPEPGRHEADALTAAIPQVVSYQPSTNLEWSHYWLSTLAGADLTEEQRLTIASVYSNLAVQDAIRDVTASLVRIGNAKRK